MKRLLCVSHYFSSHRGGIEIVAGRLAEEVAAAGTSVTWAASDTSVPPQGRDIVTLPLRSTNFVERKIGLPFPIPSAAAIRCLIHATSRADAVLVHDALYLNSIIAVLAAKWHRKPTILVQHIAEIPFRSALLRGILALANRIVTRPMLRYVDQVVFISQITANIFRNVRFRSAPLLIFNGVDCNIFQPLTCSRDEVCRHYELSTDRPLVLFVGRFVEKKGLTRMRRMVEQRPNITWVFAGWGPLDPRAWNAPNVVVRSDLEGKSLADLYGVADLLVLPSTGEGFPLVVQEALACGLPVVCGEESARADADATKLLCGVKVSATDEVTATDFLQQVDRILAMPQDADARRERANFACAHYDWKSRGRRYSEIIDTLVGSAGNRHGRRYVEAG